MAFVDRPAAGFTGDTVLTGDVAGAGEAVRQLIGYGHRRIAYLGGPARSATARRRLRGYLAALDAAGLSPTVVGDPPDAATAKASTVELLGRGRSFGGWTRTTRSRAGSASVRR